MNFLDKYIYIKFLFGQGNSHISMFSNVTKDLMIGGIFLKTFNFHRFIKSRTLYRLLIGTLGVVYVGGVVLVGYYSIKMNLLDKENTIAQLYNPQIQQLLTQTKK